MAANLWIGIYNVEIVFEQITDLVKGSVAEIFQRENFWVLAQTKALRTQDAEKGYSLGFQACVSKLYSGLK